MVWFHPFLYAKKTPSGLNSPIWSNCVESPCLGSKERIPYFECILNTRKAFSVLFFNCYEDDMNSLFL